MKILGLIPARGGSKGIPNKNITPIAGKSLIEWSYLSALESDSFDRIILSTDNQDLADEAYRIGLEVPFLRPSSLAEDETPMIDVVLHALKELAKSDYEPDAVMLLQPTSPLRPAKLIQKSIMIFESDQTIDSVCTVIPIPEEYAPHRMMIIANEYLNFAVPEGKEIKRRQDSPVGYKRDGNIFLTKTSVLLEEKDFYGNSCKPIVLEPGQLCNIDTQEQWLDAEKRLYKNL